MREKVRLHIREQGLMRAGDRVLVAVSGGADSVALLRVLLELRAELGVVLAVAHFHHGLRGAASDADEAFVSHLAQQHGLEFFAGRAEVRQYADVHKLSLEAAGRQLRYDWLVRLAREQRFDTVATAHTFDDQAETVLLKFLRGAGTRGLAGIHPELPAGAKAPSRFKPAERGPECPLYQDASGALRPRILRPLLCVRREEVEAYLAALDQDWREDESNLDHRFARNRVRHELLPLLERDYNPNLRQLLSETAEVARAEEEYWRVKAEAFLDQWQERPGRLKLCDPSRGNGILAEPLALQRKVLKSFLECRALPTDFHHVEAVRSCLAHGKADLPGGWQARRKGDSLELIPPTEPSAHENQSYETFLSLPGECYLEIAGITVRATGVDAETAAQAEPGSLLRSLPSGFRLTVRNWRPGDRFHPAHRGSEEKLKRLFAEKHIPADQRSLWPVCLMGSEIVWVRGFPVADAHHWRPGDGDAIRLEAD